MGVKLNPFTGKLDVVDSPSGDFSTVELNQGTQTNPSIVFDGSGTNTGLYSPGTGQVAISTSGTGRLFISDDGKVGIGVSDPSNYNISADDLVIADPNGFNSGISINITDNTGSSNIWFGDSDGEGRGQISYGHSTSDSMGFWVGGAQNLALYETGALAHIGGGSVITPAVSFNGSAPSNSLVIDSTGKVGLGTSTPQTLFELAADNATGGNNTLRFNDTDGTTQIGQQVGAIEFFSNDTIGGSGVIGKIECYSAGTAGNGVIGFKTGYATTLDTRLTIDHLGNVGIGTTSPSASLSVSNSGAEGIELFPNESGASVIQSYNRSGSAWIEQRYRASVHRFDISGSSEKARIDSSGRLLVGTSSARGNYFNSTVSAGLQVEDTGEQSIIAAVRDTNTPTEVPVFLLARSRGTAIGSNTVVQSGDGLGYLSYQGNDGSEFVEAARIEAVVDGTPGANDMPGRLVFSTTADGASSPTERMRITSDAYVRLASGTGGIQFNGDTAAANALDDYEEGTFTPAIEGTTSSGTGTYSLQIGRYVKIGKQVTVWIRLDWSAHTGTGTGRIINLPFASQLIAGGHHPFAATIGYELNYDVAANTVLSAYVEPNSAKIRLAQIGVGTQSGLGSATLDTAAGLTISATYETA